MFKKLSTVFITMLLSISLISCSNQNKNSENNKEVIQLTIPSNNQSTYENSQDTQVEKTTENNDKLTLDDIKAKYSRGKNGRIVNVTTFSSQYVLVEYLNGGNRQCYDWYNLATGDKDVVPTGLYNAKLKDIRNKDYIVFTTDGIFTGTGQKFFPKIIECRRKQEVPGYEEDFYQIFKSFYLPIGQGFDMGSKCYEIIRDVKVSLKGVEVMFGPMEGHEVDFYAGANAPIPHTITTYNKAENQFTIEFENTNIDNEFNKSKIKEQNRFINWIDIKNNNLTTILTISLKSTSKYYTIENSYLQIPADGFPCLDFNFADEFNNPVYEYN